MNLRSTKTGISLYEIGKKHDQYFTEVLNRKMNIKQQ